MASLNWLKFSVVNLPWPAVWVRTIPTDRNVSAFPPATALRFPAASARRSYPSTPLAANWAVTFWMSESS